MNTGSLKTDVRPSTRAIFRRHIGAACLVLLGVLLAPSHLAAQTCPCPPDEADPGLWIGTAGAGLALTGGNSDTLNVNLSFDVTRDPKTRNIMKWTGLFLRGKQDDLVVVNRLSLAFRDQYALSDRAYAYGQIEYLRDTFKLIDYLVAPTVGLGYKVLDTDVTKFAVDAGVGVVSEKNPGFDLQTSAAITAGERLEHALTSTSSLRHAATALWKADDFGDGLYMFSIGASTKLSDRLQLTVDLLDTFKSKPPTPTTKKNDVALVTAVTATF